MAVVEIVKNTASFHETRKEILFSYEIFRKKAYIFLVIYSKLMPLKISTDIVFFQISLIREHVELYKYDRKLFISKERTIELLGYCNEQT